MSTPLRRVVPDSKIRLELLGCSSATLRGILLGVMGQCHAAKDPDLRLRYATCALADKCGLMGMGLIASAGYEFPLLYNMFRDQDAYLYSVQR